MKNSRKKKVDQIIGRMDPVAKVRFILQSAMMYGRNKKLLDFAKSRNISTSEVFWQERALLTAAFEHPKLNPDKLKRGRPKRQKSRILLAGPYIEDPERTEFWGEIEYIRDYWMQTRGKKISDRKAAQIYVVRKDSLEGHAIDHIGNNFDVEVRKYQRWIKECKDELGI